MGTSADRFTGYFFTSASKRAESCGEKTDMVSAPDSLGLIASTPAPRLQRPYPSLPRPHPYPDLYPHPYLGPIAMSPPQSIQELRYCHFRAANSLARRSALNPATFLRGAP